MSDELVAEYLESLHKLEGYTSRTVDRHRRVCRRWQDLLLGKWGRSLVQALPEDLLSFIELRSADSVKHSTIRQELCVLRTLYDWLHRFQRIDSNPAAALPEMVCAPAREKQWLTVDECFQLLEAFDTSDPIGLRNYVVVALLWSTGLRTGELCALRWRDVDLQEGCLLVRRGKGRKQRQLFLNDRVLEDLLTYHQQLGGLPEDPVFFAIGASLPPDDQRVALSSSRLVETVRINARAVAGLDKPITPMTFRHTFATHMYQVGTTIEDIKELLGHDDETESTVYVHVTLDAARELLQDHVANPDRYA